MKKSCLLFTVLFLLSQLQAQETKDADWYMREANEALDAENYEYAVKTLKEGKRLFPEAYKINVILGDIYAEKELFTLAREEYGEALLRVPEDLSVLYKTSQVVGKLNEEKETVAMLERIVSLYPENTEAITDLAWMYFKTYQLTKGEKLLKESIETFGENRNFSMTLGTIYSGMYEYDSARRYYLDSIKQSPGEEGKYFSSVAYYNLSLLEHGFYHYNSALEYTDASLNLADRAPGHLARGELWKARMDFEKAHEEYQKAYSIDATPLAKINLADLYVKWGRFDSSKAYLDEVMNTTNNSWMYYFGTDMKRHYMEIHRVYEKLYEGMANRERVMPRKGIVKKIRSLFSLLSYRVLSWYHGRKYRSYSYDVGTFYQSEGNLLDADWAFYQANEQYPEVARTYLERARQFETSIAPASAPFYLLEEGKVRKDPQILHEAIDAFHPVWEREGTADALAALIPLLRREGRNIEARDALNRLYEISHSALLVNGLGLPIEIRGEVDSGLRRGLKRCGFELSPAEGGEGFLYALSLRGEGGTDFLELTDKRTGALLSRIERGPDLSAVLRDFLQTVYGIEWYGNDGNGSYKN